MRLYDTDGETFLVSGISAKGGQQRVISDWPAPASGTYYIKIDRFEFSQNTAYTLSLE